MSKRSKKNIPVNGYYKSLMKSILLIVVVVPLVPMVLVSGIMFYQFHSSYREKVHECIREEVQKGKRGIDNFLDDKKGHIRFVAQIVGVEELSEASILHDILRTLKIKYGSTFSELALINDEGVQVAYAGPNSSVKIRFSEAAWYKEAMNTSDVISTVSLGSRNLPQVILALRKEWRGRRLILRATIDYEAFHNLLEEISIGKTGSAFILDREGRYQTRLLHDRTPVRRSSMDYLGIRGRGKDEISIVHRKDDSGVKHIYATAFLDDGDLLLVLQQRASEAFSGFKKAQVVPFAVVLIVGFLIAAEAFSLSKRMVNRIAQADKEKQTLNEQMYQTGKLASIGELAAGIAHEINNPVAIMVEEAGWIDDLLEEEEFHEGKNLDEFRRALRQIQTQGKRCKEITHKLLSFARKTDHRVQEVHIDRVIDDIIAISEKRAKYQWISIHTDIQKDLPPIEASETEFQQVILNLVNNALDAMEKKGGTLSISAQLTGDNILIEVSDEGPGIPEDIVSRIFDPFFTTKPFGKGTGLGLSISYGIIKKLGGEIRVESVTDIGSKFRVMIPLSRDNGDNVKNPSKIMDSHQSTKDYFS